MTGRFWWRIIGGVSQRNLVGQGQGRGIRNRIVREFDGMAREMRWGVGTYGSWRGLVLSCLVWLEALGRRDMLN